jgi:hypothetical protein
MHNLTWKTWALLQVKIFLRLAFQRRHWTRDRQARHDLKARERCFLCNQAQETIDHIVATCPFTQSFGIVSYKSLTSNSPRQQRRPCAGGGGHVLSTIVTNVRAWTPGSCWFLGKFGTTQIHSNLVWDIRQKSNIVLQNTSRWSTIHEFRLIRLFKSRNRNFLSYFGSPNFGTE